MTIITGCCTPSQETTPQPLHTWTGMYSTHFALKELVFLVL